tara:strand:- start:2195 stop:2623 length:429 start_codon:yes stop_codon:yes gene_type:complete
MNNTPYSIKIKYKIITLHVINGKENKTQVSIKKVYLYDFPDNMDLYFDRMGNITDLSYLKTQYNWNLIGDNWAKYLNKTTLRQGDIMKIGTITIPSRYSNDRLHLSKYHSLLNYTQYKNVFISGKIVKNVELREEYKKFLNV